MQVFMMPQEIFITLENSEKLPMLSFGLQTAMEYLLGSGVWRFELARYKMENGTTHLRFNALVPNKGLTYSKCQQLEPLFDSGFFPMSIPTAELWQNEDKSAKPDNRMYNNYKEGTVISIPDLRVDCDPEHPELGVPTIGFLSFGLSDNIVGFFAMGVRTARFQISQKVMQTWFNKGYKSDDLIAQALAAQDYDENSTVGQLP